MNEQNESDRYDEEPIASPDAIDVATTRLNDVRKAGLEKVDKAQVDRVVYEMSKNSAYFKNQQRQYERTKARIDQLLAKKKTMEQRDPCFDARFMKNVDATFESVRQERDSILKIHEHLGTEADGDVRIPFGCPLYIWIDMDAFYAAVEIRDRPELANVPMAVGGEGMLTTANYVARQFGVRSAMPGFIARKLCPNLVIVRNNFEKYQAASHQVRSVIYREFSLSKADVSCASLDEACICWTVWAQGTEAAVKPQDGSSPSYLDWGKLCSLTDRLRVRIFEETKLTCSVGLAATRTLAKMCSEERKPNGCFCLLPRPEAIDRHLADMPARKIRGVGKVTAQTLSLAFGVEKIHDIYEQRYWLRSLLSDIQFQFLLRSLYGAFGASMWDSDEGSSSKSSDKGSRKLDAYFMREDGHHGNDSTNDHAHDEDEQEEADMSGSDMELGGEQLAKTSGATDTEGEEGDDLYVEGRKSISCERTFHDTSNVDELVDICKHLSQRLAHDLERLSQTLSKGMEIVGRTITVKMKRNDFMCFQRSKTIGVPTRSFEDIFSAAVELLKGEIQTQGTMTLRLMGVRVSSISHRRMAKSRKTTHISEGSASRDSETETAVSAGPDPVICPVCGKRFLASTSNEEINQHVDICLNRESLLNSPPVPEPGPAATSPKSHSHLHSHSSSSSKSKASKSDASKSSSGARSIASFFSKPPK